MFLDVLAVPVDLTTSPGDRARSVGAQTGRPERQLNSSGSLWELVAVGSGIPGLRLLLDPVNLAVDGPGDLIRGPVDLVSVPVIKSVSSRSVGSIVICEIKKLARCTPRSSTQKLTIRDALEIVVGLRMLQVGADKFVVDFVLHIRQKDERSHNTLATAGLQLGTGLTVPHVVVVSQQSTDGLGGHGQDERAILRQGLAAGHPVGLAGVTQVLGVGLDAIEVVEVVGLALTDRRRSARVESVGGEWVTSTQTVCACSTLTILCRVKHRLAAIFLKSLDLYHLLSLTRTARLVGRALGVRATSSSVGQHGGGGQSAQQQSRRKANHFDRRVSCARLYEEEYTKKR